jgi:3-dehydroquinate synthase
MVGETYLSFRLGICDRITYERIKNAVASWNLPYSLKNMNIEKALTFLQYDKKVRQGKIRFVMPRKISSVKRGVTLTVGDAWKILREIC